MYKTALILAAGDGKRMKSGLPKVLHKVCGRELVAHVLKAVSRVSDDAPVVVTGNKGELIETLLKDSARFAVQPERRGTAHAVLCAKAYLEGREGYVTVTAGDMPLITEKTFEALLHKTVSQGLDACVLTAVVDNADGYGRILRDEKDGVYGIVEHRDANEEQKKIHEINTSVYCFKIDSLLEALTKVRNNNVQSELYLTDTLAILKDEGKKIGACILGDSMEAMGINDRVQLAQAERVMRRRINEEVMRSGVTLIDPENTYIEADVEIGQDTVIYPNNLLSKGTRIGRECMLFPGSRIEASVIGDCCEIQASVILESRIGNETKIGPNAYLRPNSVIGDHVRIGDFVEVKNSTIGNGSKVSHLTYVGDAEMGQNCNVGCGTVFVNYDGAHKHHTQVGDHVFIGCNTNLVAPVKVGNNAFIAAGSTVTEDVEENDLCIARARQCVKKGWVLQNKNWK